MAAMVTKHEQDEPQLDLGLNLYEIASVIEYRSALRAKQSAVRSLACSRCTRESNAAYQAMDEADGAIRRSLRSLNDALASGGLG